MKDPFPTTSWSLIVQAQGQLGANAREALAKLCSAYWFPLYGYVRRRGRSLDDSAELVQAFFVEFLDHRLVDVVGPERGRFRAFLLHKMKHFLANERQRALAAKRGGGVIHVSFDLESAEQRYCAALADHETPERQFEKQWARTVVDRVLERLADDAAHRDKLEEFEVLRDYLTEGTRDLSYRDAASRLGTTESAVKASVRRLRQRFGRLLREEVIDTVAEPAAVDAEIRHLLGVLA